MRVLAEVQALTTVAEPERHRRLALVAKALGAANNANLGGEDELKWKTPNGIRVSRVLLRRLADALVRETGRGIARYRGEYDTHIATPQCLSPLPPVVPKERGSRNGPSRVE